MAVVEGMYYGFMAVAAFIGLLLLLLFFASHAVLTADSMKWRALAYIVAVFDAWFIGAIFGTLSCNEVCRKGGEDGSAQD
ncbi:hypothetical protein HAV1_gp36 [Hyperthermophilic Archaeal Virus 1]|jgi:phosphoglycerol transferase MdoB-like AlkP superfamily enzyme|uniref:hypothetical protein n=1 Tax=Hyperthermophilic Archaeal Virus 1 TaxID=762905 RepID=UPI0001DBAE0F|nr:hypothetical protein HAV1_gp36 [Hyperthermophilic Archaeal Virus 1]ADJ54259.1 hypothetical protein HAV1_gp36 [Hyperthermophilic Archaeal Virus 1]